MTGAESVREDAGMVEDVGMVSEEGGVWDFKGRGNGVLDGASYCTRDLSTRWKNR